MRNDAARISVVFVSLMIAVTGCSTAPTNWESIHPTVVSGDRQWTTLTAGMTEAEFVDAMSANGHSVLPNYNYRASYSDGASDLYKVLAEHNSYPDYPLSSDSEGHFKLLSGPVESICTYSPDDGGAYEAVFALSKDRTKELFANAATYLGFLVGEDFPDEVQSRSYLILRPLWKSSIEEMLSARLEEVDGGTKVVVNTESDQLVLKSRDESFARSILEHMHCTHSLLNVDRGSKTALDATTPVQLINGQKVWLSNYRILSSAYAIAGEEIEFVVASDVISDGNVVIRQGSPAWGEVLETGPATIKIGVSRVQAVDGLWYAMALETAPLILMPIDTPDPEELAKLDKSQVVFSSAHVVFPIGRIVTGIIDIK